MPGLSLKSPPLPGSLWIIALWLLFFSYSEGFAQQAPRPDTRVLIDVSGSMKQNDPLNLRIPAVKLLVNLAPAGSRFGIWSFGQQVNNLVPPATVSADWKKTASRAADGIHSRGLFTHVGGALEAAVQGLTRPDPDWDRTIVLLSDGMVDISKDPAVNEQEKKRILESVIPRLRAAGIRVHTVALSVHADQDFLQTLALQTQGTFSLARNADELMKVFVNTADKVNLPEQVPLEDDQFIIDDSVREFTALVFRRPGASETRLKAPDGQTYSLSRGSRNISWFADQYYDLVTVYNPLPGRWQVQAQLAPDSRVTVVSDLEVSMQGLPDNILEGEKLSMSMSLVERGRAITNPRFLELMDITFRQETGTGERYEGKLSHDREGNPRVPEEGIYVAHLGRTLVQGEHVFTVEVDGKTFKRRKVQRLAVYKDALDVRTEYRDENGQLIQYLLAQPRPGLADPESLSLLAQIQDASGGQSVQNASLEADGWRIDVPPVAGLSQYEVLIKVKGKSPQGREFEVLQGPYPIDYTPVPSLIESAPTDALSTPITFDDSAMAIPSLDIESLPTEDMVLADAQPDDQLPPQVQTAAEDEAEESSWLADANWLLLASVFILGNVAIIGVGVYFYLRFLRKTEVEQSRLVDEISQLRQQHEEEMSLVADPVPEERSEPVSAGVGLGGILASGPASLQLEDDLPVEVDDDAHEPLPDDIPSLDEIDRLLAEQENASREQNAARKKAVNDPLRSFAEDEFMLDNPDTQK